MEERIGQRKLFKILDVAAVVLITFILNVVVSAITALGYAFFYAVKGGDLRDAQSLMEAIVNDPSILLFSSIYNILAILIVYVFWRFVDKQDKNRLGFVRTNSTVKQVLWGLFVAVAAVMMIILLGTIFGIVSFNSMGITKYAASQIVVSLIMGMLTFLMVGFGEEAVYRSYVQNHIVDMLGNKLGLIISAFIFMAVHLLTYGKVLDLVDVFLAGIILGYGFILTKSIYLPAAFHFMWDFLQVNIFRLQNYDYYKGPVLIIFNNTGDLIINNYNYGNKLEIIFIAVELLILVLMHIYKNKISSLKAS